MGGSNPLKTIVDGLNQVIDLGIASVSDLIAKLRENEEMTGAKVLADYLEKGGDCQFWKLNYENLSEIKSFSQLLTENNIDHAFYVDLNTDTYHLLSKEIDRDKIEELGQEHASLMREISSLSYDEFRKENMGKAIHTVNGVTEPYKDVFKEEAKRLKMHIYVANNKDGTYSISYAKKDAEMAKTAIRKSIEATLGATGKINVEKTRVRSAAEKEISDSIVLNRDTGKEFYIVDPYNANKYIHFDGNGFDYFTNHISTQQMTREPSRADSLLRNNTLFEMQAHQILEKNFYQPILMSPEEFHQISVIAGGEKDRALIDKDIYKEKIIEHQKKKYPQVKLSKEAQREVELERLARQLYEYKLSYENNDLTDITNRNVSRSAFDQRENDVDRADAERFNKELEKELPITELPFTASTFTQEYSKMTKEEQEKTDAWFNIKAVQGDIERLPDKEQKYVLDMADTYKIEESKVEISEEAIYEQTIEEITESLAEGRDIPDGERVTERTIETNEERTR